MHALQFVADTTHLKQFWSQGRQIGMIFVLSAKYPEGHTDLQLPLSINPERQLMQYVELRQFKQGLEHLLHIFQPKDVSMKYPEGQLF